MGTNSSINTSKTSTSTKIKRAPLYKVVFYNDDFTPFVFVEMVLNVIFCKTSEEAQEITLKVHKEGKAIVGIYSKEIAFTKQQQTMMNADKNKFPFLCEIEPEA